MFVCLKFMMVLVFVLLISVVAVVLGSEEKLFAIILNAKMVVFWVGLVVKRSVG